jgi:hypothetical protein
MSLTFRREEEGTTGSKGGGLALLLLERTPDVAEASRSHTSTTTSTTKYDELAEGVGPEHRKSGVPRLYMRSTPKPNSGAAEPTRWSLTIKSGERERERERERICPLK